MLPAATTRTEVANGTMPMATRWDVVWVPNMLVRKSLTAVRRAAILEPPLPAASAMEPEVSSTRLTSSRRPWATEWAFTVMVETPISCEKNSGTVAWSSMVAIMLVRSMVALVTVMSEVSLYDACT